MKFFRFLMVACLLSISLEAQTLLVLNKSDNTLSFINPASLETIKTIPTGDGPHEICVSADGKTAFVANYGHQQPGNSLCIIDVVKQEEITRVDLGALFRPHGMHFVGGNVYGTAEGSRAVFRYNPQKSKVDWIMGTGQSVSHMLAVMPGGDKMYTADILSNTVTALYFNKPPLPEFCRRIAVGPKPEAIALSPDGTELWVGHNDDGKIRIINTADDSVAKEITVGKMPIRIHFTNDGKLALVSDPMADELIVIDVKKKEVQKRVVLQGAPVGLVVSPDNKSAYVALTKVNKVVKIDLAEFEVIASGTTGQNPDGIALASP